MDAIRPSVSKAFSILAWVSVDDPVAVYAERQNCPQLGLRRTVKPGPQLCQSLQDLLIDIAFDGSGRISPGLRLKWACRQTVVRVSSRQAFLPLLVLALQVAEVTNEERLFNTIAFSALKALEERSVNRIEYLILSHLVSKGERIHNNIPEVGLDIEYPRSLPRFIYVSNYTKCHTAFGEDTTTLVRCEAKQPIRSLQPAPHTGSTHAASVVLFRDF